MVTSPAERSSKFPSSELCRSSFLFRDFDDCGSMLLDLSSNRVTTLEQSPVEHTAEIWVSGPNPYGQKKSWPAFARRSSRCRRTLASVCFSGIIESLCSLTYHNRGVNLKMARGRGDGGKPSKRPIERYEHKDKKRINNPPVGLVTPETDPVAPTHKTYDYVTPVPSVKPRQELDYDPHLDPQLVWAGKKEHSSFEVPTVSLHVHERIDPHTIIEAVRKRNGNGLPVQPSLFERREENPPLREAIDFYRHAHGWSNRLIAGDSLLVMNSLLEKEGMAGQVQMVYIDPPYGNKYGSNFQPFVNKREVKDGKDEDLTQEPEMIRAFRDTWELGIHSYLTYLRDRLLLARDLLHESGSCSCKSATKMCTCPRSHGRGVWREQLRCRSLPSQRRQELRELSCRYRATILLWYAQAINRKA